MPTRATTAFALTLALAFILSESRVQAFDYFACDCAVGANAQCVPGDDGAAGTSAATAWRTYDRAQDAWASLAAGDTLSFCRGGVFPITGSTQWVNGACTAVQPCIVGAYAAPWASGGEPRPRLVQSTGPGFNLANNGAGLHEEGYVLRDLEISCTACVTGDWGVYFFNDIDDVRLERLFVHGFGIGVHIGGSNPCGADPDCDARNSRLSLVQSEIADNFDQGWLGAADDLLVADNRFVRNGTGGIFQHNLYLNQNNGASARAHVLRNEFYRSAAVATGSCQGGTVAVHGQHTDLLFENNFLHEDVGAADQGCWGLGLIPGYATAEGFLRAVVRGNTFRNMGNVAIAVASCTDCIVENNRIEHEQAFGINGVLAPGTMRGADDLPLQHLVVRNNSVFTTAGGSTAVRVGGEGTQHVIVSNALQSAAGTGTWACLALGLPLASYAAVDNNICGYVAGPGREWEEGSGALSSWRAASNFDLASQSTAPGFSDPQAPAFDLRAASSVSPMVGAGDPVMSAPTEIFGGPRTPPPDAGAHEWDAGLPSRLERSALRFGVVRSGSTLTFVTPPQGVGLTLASPGSWTATSDQPFISVTPSGSGSGTLTVQITSSTALPATGAAPRTTIMVTAPGAASSPLTITVDVQVYASGTTASPFGFFDTPVNGTVGATGAIPVTGWALDDIGVSAIELWRDPVNGDPAPASNGKIFIGNATFVSGARPDVEGLYPSFPQAYRGAWGYMLLTNLLPNVNTLAPAGGVGTFTLSAYVYDVEGHTTILPAHTVSCDNANATKPFGTIDTPAQGATVSGVVDSFGWVLTPGSATVPTDGSTIQIFVDGNVLGTAQYNLPRNDIETLFPGYTNTPGPVGYRAIDTTTLANGVHTIFWIVTDDQARADGIGSRFFTVLN